MAMISYAQNAEDVLLNRAFPEGTGFFIDVGACDPVIDSVTKHFSNRGWRGINIEPQPAVFARVCADRPRDINLNVGIADRPGTLPFYEAPEAPGWSTFSAEQAEGLRRQGRRVVERSVPILTLAEVCERYVDGPIDFLKIDAEQLELAVIQGADWSRWRPRVLVIERYGSEQWHPLLEAADYRFALCDGINHVYVRSEDRALLPVLSLPAHVGDEFVPHRYRAEIEALERRLAGCEGVGPTSLRLARRLSGLARRHPRLAALARRALRSAG